MLCKDKKCWIEVEMEVRGHGLAYLLVKKNGEIKQEKEV